MKKLKTSIEFFKLKLQSCFEHWTRLLSANRGPRFSQRQKQTSCRQEKYFRQDSFIFLVVERCYLLCNVLPTVYVTRMQILHQYLKVNKQHAQFSNKQTMTMISASDFLSKCFSKMRKLFVQSRAQLPCDSFMLCLVSVTISEDDIFKTQ